MFTLQQVFVVFFRVFIQSDGHIVIGRTHLSPRRNGLHTVPRTARGRSGGRISLHGETDCTPCHGQPVGNPLDTHGQLTGSPWAVHGQPTGTPRTAHGQYMGNPWGRTREQPSASHRLPIGNSRTAHGQPIGNPRTAHGQPVGSPWTANE